MACHDVFLIFQLNLQSQPSLVSVAHSNIISLATLSHVSKQSSRRQSLES